MDVMGGKITVILKEPN